MTDLLRRALEGRLGEVRDRLRVLSLGETPDGPPGSAPAEPPEESLRQLMVSVLPVLRDRPDPGPVRARFFALLSDLESAARSSDLRYLDAWNSACEVLLSWPREDLDRDDARRALRTYATLLEEHVRRLGGGS